jgi:patatin-like phospholipase/acyl hydrolase
MAVYRVLSFDGGGIRGVVTATLLERLGKAVPDLLSKVDMLAGTSTGGIIALGLARGLTPSDMKKLYVDEGKRIFDDSIWDDVIDLGRLRGAEYGNKKLRNILKKLFGVRTKLSHLRKRVVIPAFDLDNEHADPDKRTWKPKVFHNFPGKDSDGGMLAWKVGLYTSAAPTYFPSVDGYVDGGVYANNPGMIALTQTQDKRTHAAPPDLSSVRLLSIGSGNSLTYIQGDRNDWGYAQWMKPIIALMTDGTMGIADYQCRGLLGGHYHRFAPTFPGGKSYPLDDIDGIPRMVAFAESLDTTETVDWLKSNW